LKDLRLEKMADGLINYSVRLQKGEKILVEVIDSGVPLALAVIKETYRVGGVPFVIVRNKQIDRQFMLGASKEQLEQLAGYEMVQMKEMNAYLGIRAADNANETADVPSQQQQVYMKHYSRPITDQRVNHTK
jgi:aminopeptidase